MVLKNPHFHTYIMHFYKLSHTWIVDINNKIIAQSTKLSIPPLHCLQISSMSVGNFTKR